MSLEGSEEVLFVSWGGSEGVYSSCLLKEMKEFCLCLWKERMEVCFFAMSLEGSEGVLFMSWEGSGVPVMGGK